MQTAVLNPRKPSSNDYTWFQVCFRGRSIIATNPERTSWYHQALLVCHQNVRMLYP